MITQSYARRVMQITFLSLLVGLFLFIFGPVRAQGEEEIVKTKRVSGEISVIRPSYINIIFAREKRRGAEYEAMFLLNDDVKFIRKDLEELEPGDRVEIKYDGYFKIEKNEETGEEEERFVRRVTKEIRFVSPSTKGKLISK